MLLADAVHAIETVGGILLGMSGIAFILLAIVVAIRQRSGAAEALESRDEFVEFRDPSTHGQQLSPVAKIEMRPASKKAPARKAA
jgi:hypothetical protein